MSRGFAIVVEKSNARVVSDVDYSNTIDVEKGMLVEIKNTNKSSSEVFCVIQIFDYYDSNPAFVHNVYFCKRSALLEVNENLLPFLIAITDPYDRLNVARDKEYSDYILSLQENSFVEICGENFRQSDMRQTLNFSVDHNNNPDFDCIVRYIGMCPEIGPGYFFGLELLNLDKGHSPQAVDIYGFVGKYIKECDPELVFLVPANFLKIYRTVRSKKNRGHHDKSVFNNLICGVKEKFKDAKKSVNSNTLKNSKRNSIVSPLQDNTSDSNSASSTATLKRSLTPDAKTAPLYVDLLKENMNTSKFPASISSPNLAKQDSSSSTGSSSRYNHNLIDLNIVDNSDEFKIFVEDPNMLGNRGTQTTSNSSSASDIMGTPKPKKKSMALPIPTKNINIKPSTILSLPDRDLVIIDKSDIKEAVSHESDVIIVDPPPPLTPTSSDQDHVDLQDILGGQWPDIAGGAAGILNSEKRHNSTGRGNGSNGYKTFERSKSPNPMSHFGGTKQRSSVTFENGNESKYNGRKKQQNGGQNYENLSDDLADIVPSPYLEIPGSSLGLGSVVEVHIDNSKNLHGVIRWIGKVEDNASKMPNGYNGNPELVVGVELDDVFNDRSLKLNDGVYNGQRCFRCPDKRAIFVSPKQCTNDRRFHDMDMPSSSRASTIRSNSSSDAKNAFGDKDCPIVEGSVPALKIFNYEELENRCGKFKGIQGHHNSCYLDATLFSMFTFTSVFDSLLFRPREPEDNEHYEEVQKVLREEIVNPLRKNLFVRADRVLKLRQLLDKLSSVKGLTTEEKDPEEFLNSLLAQILRADPFLKLSSGLDAFYYQLFVEKDEKLALPTVQELFEQSFLTSDIKLKEVPSCLIIQMPRFGKNFKMYPRILPSQVLDVTDIIEDSPRQCTICGKLAEFECRDCFGALQLGTGLESIAFCKGCLQTAHNHQKRANHKPKPLSIPQDFKNLAEFNVVPRLFMELFAVVCIETSHYVTFTKTGSGIDSPWVFFDSMADRKGEQNGYNIPEMVPVPDLPLWLSDEGAKLLHENNDSDKSLPEYAKRLYCDAYMMIYQSTDMMMYR